MDQEWNVLYEAAKGVLAPRDISKSMRVAIVGAAVQTKSGNIYTGVCIDMWCSLGMCAERNALSTMITHGEDEVVRVCSVGEDGNVIPSCGACREFMMQLGGTPADIQILLDNDGTYTTLGQLIPHHPN